MQSMLKVKLVIFIAIIGLMFSGTVFAQEPIGGPYTADSNTMLLLHFDGDFTNESSFSEDATGFGNYQFFNASVDPSLNQSLRLDNDAPGDSAFVTVADTSYLDLTDAWTIEGWINIFTFGTTGSHRWVPRLIIKTGDEVFWRPNYWIEMWGSDRFFSFGYHNAAQTAWPQVNTPNNFMDPGIWYHLAFIRDTTNQVMINMIHDANRDLIFFNAVPYDPVNEDPPITTNQDVHIGWAGSRTIASPSNDSWLDGFVDEIRVSNTVRNFSIPPVITNTTDLENQTTSVPSYDVDTEVFKVGAAGSVQSVNIMYSADGGATWQSEPMSQTSGNTYSGSIPGSMPLGTIVDYYIQAEDDGGLQSTDPAGAISDSIYYSFGIFQENTQTVELTFEEGSGTPQDGSQYGNPVTMAGNPVYSTNSAAGTYSMEFEGDSSYLDINTPFLAAPEFTVDFWFNMDSLNAFRRIVSLGTSTGSTNYMVFLMDDSTLTAESSIENDPIGLSGLRDELKMNTKIQANTWYQVRYQLSQDSVLLQLWDENGSMIEQTSLGIIGPATQLGGHFRVGLLYNHTGYYAGRVDNVQVWNYALDLPTAIEPVNEPGIPSKVELFQNYPNPFNPSTDIKFHVAKSQKVNLTVYDLLGRKVKTLVDEKVSAGKYKASWDGTSEIGQRVSSGVYFYRLQTKGFTQTRKMLLMK